MAVQLLDARRLYVGLAADTRPEGEAGDRLYLEDEARTLWYSENKQVKEVAIDDGGAGYAVGDDLTFEPDGAAGTVQTVDANGAITAITLTANGSYVDAPGVVADETTGSGAQLRAVLSDGWRNMDPASSLGGGSVGAIVDT